VLATGGAGGAGGAAAGGAATVGGAGCAGAAVCATAAPLPLISIDAARAAAAPKETAAVRLLLVMFNWIQIPFQNYATEGQRLTRITM
jgi:hypothetical protein